VYRWTLPPNSSEQGAWRYAPCGAGVGYPAADADIVARHHGATALLRAVAGIQMMLPRVLPNVALRAVGKVAGLLGHFGWRSPLRSIALRALHDGVREEPTVWNDAGCVP